MSRVSDNMTRIRLKRKLTQGELADKLSVAADTVIGWESGASLPDIDMLREIANTMNVDISVLIDRQPDSEARKKDVRQLILSCAIALVLGIASYFLTPLAQNMSSHYYDMSLTLILRLFLLPACWLAAGWALMHVLSMLGVARPGRSGVSRPIHIAILVLVLLYTALMLPLAVETVYQTILLAQYRQNPSLYPDGYQYVSRIPVFLSTIQWKIMSALYHQAAVFVIPGILLCLTGPVRLTTEK